MDQHDRPATGDPILDDFIAEVAGLVGTPRSYADVTSPDEATAAKLRAALDRAVDRKLREGDGPSPR